MKSNKRAFTFSELLVSLAIFAILAATLIPVLAKAAGKDGNESLEQYKNRQRQVGRAIAEYAEDNNATYPLAMCRRPITNTWGILLQTPVPADGVLTPPWNTAARVDMASHFWANAIQPYLKHGHNRFQLPGADEVVFPGEIFNPAEVPEDMGIMFNGELHAFNTFSVVNPDVAVLLWQPQNANLMGRGESSPDLNCSVTGPCGFDPVNGTAGAFGANDVLGVIDFTHPVWLFDKNTVVTHTDGSVKVHPTGNFIDPNFGTPADSLNDPWSIVSSTGAPEGFWDCGSGGPGDFSTPQFACYFRPDRVH